MQLFVMRHFPTQDNVENRFGSAERDLPVLKILGTSEFNLPQLPLAHLAHTGLVRTKQTLEVVSQILSADKCIELCLPQFQERYGGKLSGLLLSELQIKYPELASPNNFWKIEDPEEGLESAKAFLARIENGLLAVKSMNLSSLLMVAHAGSIKGISAVLETDSFARQLEILCCKTPGNGQLSKFEL